MARTQRMKAKDGEQISCLRPSPFYGIFTPQRAHRRIRRRLGLGPGFFPGRAAALSGTTSPGCAGFCSPGADALTGESAGAWIWDRASSRAAPPRCLARRPRAVPGSVRRAQPRSQANPQALGFGIGPLPGLRRRVVRHDVLGLRRGLSAGRRRAHRQIRRRLGLGPGFFPGCAAALSGATSSDFVGVCPPGADALTGESAGAWI